MAEKNKKIETVEEAKKVLAEAESKEKTECWKEIQVILEKYGFQIEITNTISFTKKNG